jgi:phage-related protein
MAMNVGELVATLDVEDRGYTRGLTGAVAEARTAAVGIEDALDGVDAEAAGQSAGDGFVRGLDGRLRDGRGRFVAEGSEAGSRFGAGLASGVGDAAGGLAQRTTGIVAQASNNVWVLLGVVALAMAALVPLGAAAAIGIVGGFGAGIAGVGLATAAQSQEVRDEFSQLKDDVTSDLREISAPFEDTLLDIADTARSTFGEFKPALEQAFEDTAPVVSDFAENVGDALGELEPAIGPLTSAFNDLLTHLGPMLGPVVEDIEAALSDLAGTVSENPEYFAAFVAALLQFIPVVITVVDWLARAYAASVDFGLWLKDDAVPAVTGFAAAVWGFITGVGGWFSDTISSLGSGIDSFVTGTLAFFAGGWDMATGAVSAAGSGIQTAVSTTIGFVTGVVGGGWSWLTTTTANAWSAARGTVSGVAGGIRTTTSGLVSGVRGSIATGWAAVTGTTSSAWSSVRGSISGALNGALSFARSIPARFVSIGRGIITGVISGVSGAAGALYDRLRGIASNALSAAQDALGINSPSTVFADQVGQWIPAGIADGITAGSAALSAQVADMSAGLVDAARPDRGAAAAGRGGIVVENVTVNATSGQFNTRQVLTDVAWQLAV